MPGCHVSELEADMLTVKYGPTLLIPKEWKHGGIVCINGQYYIFDHRHTNHSSYSRQGVEEPIFFDEKGMIAQVEATSCGLNGGALEGKGKYPAYIACNLFYEKGVEKEDRHACVTQDIADVDDVETFSSCGKLDLETVGYLHDISDKCRIGYKYFEVKESLTQIMFTIRGHAKGTLSIALSETIEISESAGKILLDIDTENWEKLLVPVDIPCGRVALFFGYSGEGRFDMLEFELL